MGSAVHEHVRAANLSVFRPARVVRARQTRVHVVYAILPVAEDVAVGVVQLVVVVVLGGLERVQVGVGVGVHVVVKIHRLLWG